MKQIGRFRLSLVLSAISIWAIILLILANIATGPWDIDGGWVIFALLFVVWLLSTLAAISYSENGWAVEGSALEWVAAVLINPGWAFIWFLVHVLQRQSQEPQPIDPHDDRRIERL